MRGKYAGFGPTLAAEKLAETERIAISRESIRRLQIAFGLWKPKSRKARRAFLLRERRPRFGELIQIDGSQHDWFEGRAPRCALIMFIDDATGRLTALHMAPAESTKAYLVAYAAISWHMGRRWRSTRIVMASFASTPKKPRAATARPSSTA